MMRIEEIVRLFMRMGGLALIRRWMARLGGQSPAARQAGEAARRMEQVQRITRKLWR